MFAPSELRDPLCIPHRSSSGIGIEDCGTGSPRPGAGLRSRASPALLRGDGPGWPGDVSASRDGLGHGGPRRSCAGTGRQRREHHADRPPLGIGPGQSPRQPGVAKRLTRAARDADPGANGEAEPTRRPPLGSSFCPPASAPRSRRPNRRSPSRYSIRTQGLSLVGQWGGLGTVAAGELRRGPLRILQPASPGRWALAGAGRGQAAPTCLSRGNGTASSRSPQFAVVMVPIGSDRHDAGSIPDGSRRSIDSPP